MTGQGTPNQHPQQQQYSSLAQQQGMNLGTSNSFMTQQNQQPNVAAGTQHQQPAPQQTGYPQYNQQGYYPYGNQGLAGTRGNQQGYWNQ